MRGTTRLLQEVRGWHLVYKVRRFGHAAKVLLTGGRVRHTRDFGSGQTRQEFRAYWDIGARCHGRNIGKGEGEMESHDIRIAHTFCNIKPLEPCVCPHA